jgi:hypothetical protein
MKVKAEVIPLNARVNVRVCRAFDIEVAKKRITKQQAVEEALRLWLNAQEKQSEGLAVRAPILPSEGRDQYILSAREIDDAVLG